jgi:acetyltransferase-like isoleucine patch superfamily enzyme
VKIGSFNQISYNCIVWDTNTHNIYNNEIRRQLTVDHFPSFGMEFEKPKTSPVIIGDDCWIGREAALLRGSCVGNSSIVGFRANLVNFNVESNMTAVSKSSTLVFQRK